MSGLTSAGLVIETATEIKDALDAAFKAGPLGDSAGTETDGSIPAQTAAGQEIAIITDGFSALWEALEDIAGSLDPAQATGTQLDNLCALTGTVRDPARASTVTGTCCGTPATALSAGRVASVEDTDARFASTAAGAIAALTAWASSTAYVVGDRRTNAARCYVCITAGTSAGSGGPTTDADDITDGTAHWRYLGEGTGAVDVEFEAEETGPIGALSGKLNQIETPVSGWQTVRNLLDAEVGADEELDSDLRAKREAELAAQGNATPDAIRADVLRVGEDTDNPVDYCRVFYNDSDSTDANGLPPHSVEVLVLGGEDDEVAAAIFGSVAGGIYTHGTTSETVTDSLGNTQTVRFTRPTEIEIYVDIDVTYNPAIWTAGASELEDVIKEAIVATGGKYDVGDDVKERRLAASVFERDDSTGLPLIIGIVDVTDCDVGTAPSPSGSSVTIGIREIARFDSSRITVNLSTGSL